VTARFMQPVEINLFRANSGTDSRLVPASGASIAVAFLGATVTEAVTVYDWGYGDVHVGGNGRVKVGDDLQRNADSSATMTVATISEDGTVLSCVADGSTPISLTPGDRLIIISRVPGLYSDSAGDLPITGNVVTVNSLGYARFYTPEASVDYFASGGGLPSTLFFQDVQAGWIQAARPTVNVLDFPTFQAAHDALPEGGGTIFVPQGTYDSSSPAGAFTGLVVTKAVSIVGEASGLQTAISVILHNMSGYKDIDAIYFNIGGGASVRNIALTWPGGTPLAGDGRGIRWYVPGNTVRLAGLTIENVLVHLSPNWSFEFSCDGHDENYVSKLEMTGCSAYEAQSGGSLFLGGAGTNNNFINRCEFDGPGFGGYHNVIGCSVTQGSSTVTAPNGTAFSGTPGVHAGDEVFGMGIAIGTTVTAVNTTANPNTLTLSSHAIQSYPNTSPARGTTVLTFYRAAAASGQMLRGHMHLMRTLVTRCEQCSFQGPGSTPAVSTDLVSGDLLMRDTYREKSTSGDGVHSFLISGMSNLLIDGLFHQWGAASNKVLQTGQLGLSLGRITNAQAMTNQDPLASTDVILLNNDTDDLIVDNSSEISSATGAQRDFFFAGSYGVPSIASASTISLPNGSDEVFILTGAASINHINALRPKRVVTFILQGGATATLLDGGTGNNLKLNGDFGGTGWGYSTITLVCDGVTWFEVSRSHN